MKSLKLLIFTLVILFMNGCTHYESRLAMGAIAGAATGALVADSGYGGGYGGGYVPHVYNNHRIYYGPAHYYTSPNNQLGYYGGVKGYPRHAVKRVGNGPYDRHGYKY